MVGVDTEGQSRSSETQPPHLKSKVEKVDSVDDANVAEVGGANRMKPYHSRLAAAACAGGAIKALCEKEYGSAASLFVAFAAIQSAHSFAHVAEGIHTPTFGHGFLGEGLGKVGEGIEKGGKHMGEGVRSAGEAMREMQPVQVDASVWPKPKVTTSAQQKTTPRHVPRPLRTSKTFATLSAATTGLRPQSALSLCDSRTSCTSPRFASMTAMFDRSPPSTSPCGLTILQGWLNALPRDLLIRVPKSAAVVE